MAAACFRPTSAATIAGVAAYGVYLAWVGTGIAGQLGTTAYAHLLCALATLGAWLGSCFRRVGAWPGAVLVPGYRRAAHSATAAVGVAGFAGAAVAAWVGGLALWPLATVGVLGLAVAALGGFLAPVVAVYLQMGMWIVAILAPGWGAEAVDLGRVAPPVAWAGAALPSAAVLVWTLRRIAPASARRSRSWAAGRWAGLRWPGALWEPSFARVAGLFAGFGVVAALVQGPLGATLRADSWMVLIATLCANTAATGASVALPRGPLAGAARLLVHGVARRGGVGRRVHGKILRDSLTGVAAFASVAAALGVDFELVAMQLVGFACTSAYLAAASHSRWLMANRLSGLVATPVVVGLALAAWEYGSWGLPSAVAVWTASGGVAVVVGGLGIGRHALDLGTTREAMQE